VEAIPVFLIALVITLVLSIPAGGSNSCSTRFVLGTLAGELGFFIATVTWLHYVDRGRVAALGLPGHPGGDLLWGIATGLALVVAGGIVIAITRAVGTAILGHAPREPEQVLPCVQGAALVVLAPIVVLAAPIGEETFFRGYLFKGLRRRFALWPAAAISAVAFGAAHFSAVSFLLLVPGLIVVGLGLAIVYEKRQSLVASVTAHATFNLIGYLMIALSRR